MMEEWKEYTLKDIVTLVIDYRGKTPLKLGGNWSQSGYRALSAKNIKTGTIVNEESIRFVDEELYKKWMKDEVQRGDIFVTSEAPFGQVYYWDSDEKIVLSQRLFCLRLSNNVFPKFVYYQMTTSAFQSELDGRATGTTVIGLRQPELLKCKIQLPDLSEQKQIASILSSLDDKIELNRRINENLEAQAQALFKSWFVDFEPFCDGEFVESELGMIPKGWRVISLEAICTIKYGKGLGKNDLVQNGFPVFGGNGIIGYYPQYLYELPQILVSCRGAASGKIIESLPKSYVTSNSLVLELKDRLYYNYLKYLLLSYPLYDYATGSAQPQITIDNIKGVKILLPYKDAIQKVNQSLENIGNLQRINQQESTRLATLRDTLLPRLMSGEIKVGDVTL